MGDVNTAIKDTGSLDLLIFEVEDRVFGINVAKVQEIIEYEPLTPVPKANPNIEGMFMPRNIMITVIDLKRVLGLGEAGNGGDLILTNFNALNMAFHVDKIRGIHRATWQDIMRPSEATDQTEESLKAILDEVGGLETIRTGITGDARPGREDEKWLNVLLRKTEGKAEETRNIL